LKQEERGAEIEEALRRAEDAEKRKEETEEEGLAALERVTVAETGHKKAEEDVDLATEQAALEAAEEEEEEEKAASSSGCGGSADDGELAAMAKAAEDAREIDLMATAGPPRGYSFMGLFLDVEGLDLDVLAQRKWKIPAMVVAVFEDQGVSMKASVDDVFAQTVGSDGKCRRDPESLATKTEGEGDDAAPEKPVECSPVFLQLQEKQLSHQQHKLRGAQAGGACAEKPCPVGVSVRLLLRKSSIENATLVSAKSTGDQWIHRAKDYQVVVQAVEAEEEEEEAQVIEEEEEEDIDRTGDHHGIEDISSSCPVSIVVKEMAADGPATFSSTTGSARFKATFPKGNNGATLETAEFAQAWNGLTQDHKEEPDNELELALTAAEEAELEREEQGAEIEEALRRAEDAEKGTEETEEEGLAALERVKVAEDDKEKAEDDKEKAEDDKEKAEDGEALVGLYKLFDQHGVSKGQFENLKHNNTGLFANFAHTEEEDEETELGKGTERIESNGKIKYNDTGLYAHFGQKRTRQSTMTMTFSPEVLIL